MNKQRKEGTVVWFSSKRGYGFVKPDDGSKDIFVHFSSIVMEGYKLLKAGDRISFDVQESSDRGTLAIEVELI